MTARSLRPVALVLLAVVLGVTASVRVEGRASSARDHYEEAVALDHDARAGAERGGAAEEVASRAARRALVLYESVVRRYPTSGYCDNALMRGGDLARWLFTRSGRASDRAVAAKYYTWLIREYPGSGLRGQARAAARALETPDAEPARRRVSATALEPARAASPASTPRGLATTTAGAPALSSAAHAPVTPPVAPPTAPPTLRGIDRAVVGSAVRVTLMLDRETTFAHELLEGPRRAFIDLFGATPAADLQDAAIRYDGDAVRQVRVGRRPGATRVVLDLDGAAAVSVFTLYNPFRVVIDAERPAIVATVAPSMFTSAPPVVAPAVLRDEVPAPPRDENEVVSGVAAPAPAPAPPASTAPAPVLASAATSDPGLDVELTAPVPSVPAANRDGSFSLARQLGLGISRIVIDAGHGGHDPGTVTQGTSEARLVLDVALRLERLLNKEPGLQVVLTRRTDVFIPLEQRTAIANREGADLFLSIHANASRDRNARGVETYFLSFASNPEAEAVAARENATSASDMHSLPSIVRAIALNNKLDESRDLASMVQQSLTARLSKTNPAMRSRGVKKAPFVVLIGAGMPSVLAEIGFLTNRQESGLVKTPAYRQRIAESLHAAVMQYRRALKRQTSVATR